MKHRLFYNKSKTTNNYLIKIKLIEKSKRNNMVVKIENIYLAISVILLQNVLDLINKKLSKNNKNIKKEIIILIKQITLYNCAKNQNNR